MQRRYNDIMNCSNNTSIKRVTFLATKLAGGGAERVVSVLTSALAELGYHVDLILYERRENEYPISDKVKIHLLPKRTQHQGKVSYLVNKFLVLRRMIKECAPDVLVPFLPYQVEQCYVASRGLKIPMVVTVRNNPQFDTANENQRKRRDWIAKHVEGVFLQAESQRDYFKPSVQKKCFVVPNPISQSILDASYEYRNNISKLVTMGRLSEQKNHEMLIRAFSKVHETHPDITLDIYGEGPLKEKLQDLIAKLNLQSSVYLCGRTNNVAETLCQYDLFVLSSNFEGMPNALMEAMGVGLPCISTDCPTGPRELLGTENGLLVDVDDVDGLSRAIEKAVIGVTEMHKRGEHARIKVREDFSPEAIATLLIEELENLR